MTPFVIDRWAAWDTLPTGDGGSGKVRKCNGEEGEEGQSNGEEEEEGKCGSRGSLEVDG